MNILELGYFESVEQIFINLSKLTEPFWLDSAQSDGHLGRYSFLGALPMGRLEMREGECKLTLDGMVKDAGLDAIETLSQMMQRFEAEKGPFPFNGGAVGFLSYDLKGQIEKLPQTAIDDLALPLMSFGLYDIILVYCHEMHTLSLVRHHFSDTAETRLQQIITAMTEHIDAPEYAPGSGIFNADQSKETYMAGVERVREYIRSGDIYQANYTQRISCPYDSDALGLYLRLRKVNPAPFAAFLPYSDFTVLSSSPERFLRCQGNRLETRPIKGTSKRGTTLAEDQENKAWLEQSEKDHSELLMIVDLERNDLSRISKVGSVKVPELFAIETYPTVFHLVSTVVSELKEHASLAEIIRATFPGGSITGAPKIRAMEVIDSLEKHARGLYTGAIGYIDFCGDFDFNIVIRTLIQKGGTLYFGVGGGIVWDSDPESEYLESLTKAKALMRTITGGDGYVLEQ